MHFTFFSFYTNMYLTVTFLVIIIQLPYKINSIGTNTCTPNTQFILNGFLCLCNHDGHWYEVNCKMIGRRNQCQPGQVVRRGCTQCVCKNGNFVCDNTLCFDEITELPTLQKLSNYGPRCTPFRSYYVNCSLCICPASGLTSEAQCAVDVSCPLFSYSSALIQSTAQNHCLPNVIYMFPCVECVCSDHGFFSHERCTEKCHKQSVAPRRRCIPGTLYRINCSICRCPSNSIPDSKICEKVKCNNRTLRPIVQSIKPRNGSCTLHVFTEPKCLYCDCKPVGIVNEKSCVELNCSKAFKLQNEVFKDICSPGELVPICVECFCVRNNSMSSEYCTKNCSSQSKLDILKKVLNTSLEGTVSLIDENALAKVTGTVRSRCVPNSLYLDEGRYCLCPKSADTSFKFCTSYYKYLNTPTSDYYNIDFNITCKPSTLVEFGCNVCFCSKNGTIDPKWCTYDDCEAKKIIQDSHKTHTIPLNESKLTCTPGEISTVKCNYCICPENGIFKDRVCTKNDCGDYHSLSYEKFTCEPLAYYEVDCNICYCPHDGLKNVALCTNVPCETNFLRSSYCVPGHLFTDACNVCICPTNGNKDDKVCTSRECDIKTWNVFKLPETLMGNEVIAKRSIDVCFHGEEFVEGCKLCVCPEEELKAYATCDTVLCENVRTNKNITSMEDVMNDSNDISLIREKREAPTECSNYNISNSAERKDCTPGTMYIIRCRQCICPYAGNINNFCRPLPKNMHCEQAFPGVNYMPMGRRHSSGTTFATPNYKQELKLKHNHTKYDCERNGRITDMCFICECKDNVLIEEHCFKSDAEDCLNSKPSFIRGNKVIKLYCCFDIK